jgi:TetR/AcrR family transcriptional regulator
MTDFKRARQSDQKASRRRDLLDAAANLFDAEGPAAAGLNAIAAQAGFTKSNVYRYFESREAVLLALFLEEFDGFATQISTDIRCQKIGDVAALANVVIIALVCRQRLCRLIAIYGAVLERNISSATIEAEKTLLMQKTAPVVAALVDRLPGATAEDCGWAFAMTMALLAGMWPGVEPSPAAATVLAKPDLTHMVLTLDRELRRAIEALLSSVTR